jgi:periplasmic divalent cation tolerance protein
VSDDLARRAVVVLITAPPDLAPVLARSIVDARLAACVTTMPIRSIYRWKNDIHDDEEHQLVVKTTRDCFAALEAHVAKHHRYEVPELLMLEVLEGGAAYLSWLAAETHPAG